MVYPFTRVCRQCRGDHLKSVRSTEVDIDVQDSGPASTSHPEPQIHEPSCSAELAEEIVELPRLPPATEESEELSAAPVLHVRFQEDLISEVRSSPTAKCEYLTDFKGVGRLRHLFCNCCQNPPIFRRIQRRSGRGRCLMYWAKCWL